MSAFEIKDFIDRKAELIIFLLMIGIALTFGAVCYFSI